jgi:hypothetical protein
MIYSGFDEKLPKYSENKDTPFLLIIDDFLEEDECNTLHHIMIPQNDMSKKDTPATAKAEPGNEANSFEWGWNRNLFPWMFAYEPSVGGKTGLKEKESDTTAFLFVHNFYFQTVEDDQYIGLKQFKSSYYSILTPLLNKIRKLEFLNFNRFFRIKSNLYPSRSVEANQNDHLDFLIPHVQCLYMINSNDGATKVKFQDDEFIVEAVKNRMLMFDGTVLHAPIGPVETDYKLNIVTNLFADVNLTFLKDINNMKNLGVTKCLIA